MNLLPCVVLNLTCSYCYDKTLTKTCLEMAGFITVYYQGKPEQERKAGTETDTMEE